MLPQGFIEGQKTWPNDGENDLVEHMQNHQAYETQSTVHFGSSDNANYIYKIESVPADVDFYDKFHSITMRWETDKIEYFLDTQTEPYFSLVKSNETAFNNYYWPFNEDFYLLVKAKPLGPTCHKNNYSCFESESKNPIEIINILEGLVDNRKIENHEGSYINSLLQKGVKEISKKVTEEAGETAISAVTNDGRLIDESADLLFHLIVLLKSQELSIKDVMIELSKRNANQ